MLRRGCDTFHCIPIHEQGHRALLAQNPVAAAETFRLMIENVFSVILQTPAEHNVKRTVPIAARKMGVFGTPLASAGFIEEQAHLHIAHLQHICCKNPSAVFRD